MSDRKLTPQEEREGRNLMLFFRGVIALHRLTARSSGLDNLNNPSEEECRWHAAKRTIVEHLGVALRGFSEPSKARCKAFSAELTTHCYDLSLADELIIQDVLRRVLS